MAKFSRIYIFLFCYLLTWKIFIDRLTFRMTTLFSFRFLVLLYFLYFYHPKRTMTTYEYIYFAVSWKKDLKNCRFRSSPSLVSPAHLQWHILTLSIWAADLATLAFCSFKQLKSLPLFSKQVVSVRSYFWVPSNYISWYYDSVSKSIWTRYVWNLD